MNISERFDNLERVIAEDRLIRNAWTEGQDRVCLLAALAPEAGKLKTASACPADVIPKWLAYLTPLMDDHGTQGAWPEFVRRYSKVVRSAALTLDSAGWRRTRDRIRMLIVSEAMRHTDNTNTNALDVCSAVVAMFQKAVDGDPPTYEEWTAAEAEATAAEWAAAAATATRAASAATRAASAATRAAATTRAATTRAATTRASAAAEWASEAAFYAASAAAAEWTATRTAEWTWCLSGAATRAASAATRAAWDRMNDSILGVIEAETKARKAT